MKHIISLGAGVQSSTMALMATAGLITPMPDAAIFADTQAEPKAVYDWLDILEPLLSFPVHRVTQGNLTDTIAAKRPTGLFRRVDIPAFVAINGRPGGLINRSCTRDFKIRPIEREVRRLVGLTRKRSPSYPVVTQWIGISTDEDRRVKQSRNLWVTNRWPLIELGMDRADCLEWMKANGFPAPPKSSCIYCPFHGTDQWLLLTESEWGVAIDVDHRLRAFPAEEYRNRGSLYLHRSCKPLSEVKATLQAKNDDDQFDRYECEGACGL